MKVAIYAHVSKETSDNTNQLLILRDYCDKMEYKIHDEYVGYYFRWVSEQTRIG